MRDKTLYVLFLMGENKVIRFFYLYYYKLVINIVSFILRSRPYIKDAYLKGSFGKSYFIPVISDLDFFLCGDTREENRLKIEKIFTRLNKLFPIVSDFDFHSKVEADYLISHAGLKFATSSSWITIKGTDVRLSYKFHPRKFNTDIVHEIYFQLEWLFKNLRKRKNNEKFVSVCIQRQYQKIHDLLSFFNADIDKPFENTKFHFKEKWFSFSNEEIIEKFNSLISRNERIQELVKIYQRECSDIDLLEVLKEKYYQNELVLIDQGSYSFNDKNHYLTYELFQLFFYIGCIDSYMILDWIQKSKDHVVNIFLKSLYFSRLIENRVNFKHDTGYFYDNLIEALSLKKKISNSFNYLFKKRLDLFNENVFVIPLSMITDEKKRQIKEFLLDATERDWRFKIVLFELLASKDSKNGEDFSKLNPSMIEHVQLVLNSGVPYCDFQTQRIIKLGIDWSFGAKNIISWDYQIKIPCKNFWKSLETKLKEDSFVIPYRKLKYQDYERDNLLETSDSLNSIPSFLWGGRKECWDEVKQLIGHNLDLYSNEIFYYTLTGTTDYIPDTEKVFPQMIQSLRSKNFQVNFIDFTLELQNETSELFELNQKMLRSISFEYLLDSYSSYQFGLQSASGDLEHVFQINYLLAMQEKLSPDDYLFELNSLNNLELLNFGQYFYLLLTGDIANTLIGHGGAYGVLEESANGFLIKTGNSKDCDTFEVHYKLKIKEEYPSGLYRVSFRVDPQVSYDAFTMSAKLKPNGVECDNPIEESGSISDTEISLWAELSPETSYILFEAQLNLHIDSHYYFEDWRIEKIDSPAEETYFRKIENGCSLGEFPRGKYRLVINLLQPTSGSIDIFYAGKKRMPCSQIQENDTAIIYLFINEVSRSDVELILCDIKESEITSIDIFKY